MGIAMSITAFPVLARIIQEKKMAETPIGAMALACAAVDDVTAWCLLAGVIGIIKAGSPLGAFGIVGASICYVFIMHKIVRPFLERVVLPATQNGKLTQGQLALVFCVLLGSALVTEVIGIHALFGAFLAGVSMPRDPAFRKSLTEKIEDICGVVLLPIFFAYAGLRVQVGLMNSWTTLWICAAIVFFAVAGKMVGTAVAAKWSGMKWNDAWMMGAFMNTRGLMELVVLNIGLDLGIISSLLYSMMVIMALVTTFMTAPLISWLRPNSREGKRAHAAELNLFQSS
jgi:Kef-type K+ transport system membrane component KefB